ncbi:uncharacterized protein LOC110031446 isoform X3 [Phalaenopsis equestris]|uniref:uncharacterized protein LOC110031446 isoform X3 n=2 Tax=Phalaenopsis equestris TaxID=78828 RepID=UPI0009E1EAB3|nr:uncharacterized protein LOC110031446 isoform X3 [Phalaenopsis equestris]
MVISQCLKWVKVQATYMGLLSLFEKLNLRFGMPYMPKTTSAPTMEAKEFKEVEQVSTVPLAGDHHEIVGVDKDTRVRNDETGSCKFGMDCKCNHASREGDRKQGNIASSEKFGQMECKFYLSPGGCKSGNDCRFRHNVQLNFMGLPIRPGEKMCLFYMRTGGCKFAGSCRFHHPDPIAVVGDSFQDLNIDVPSQQNGQVEQLYKTPKPLGNTSTEQTALLSPLTPNQGLQQNEHWNGNQISSSPLHAREMNRNEFNGGVKSQQFDEYPQRPGEPECQYFTKTGCCKFKSSCQYHHPKSKYCDPIEHLCVTPLSLENTLEEQTAILGPSLSYVPNLFTPNQGFKSNSQWNENQAIRSLLHPPDIRTTDRQQELSIMDAASEFSGGEPQQFDEYPQRPSEPECQYFMKTGYCKFKSACRYHHPKSYLSSWRPASNNSVPLQQDDSIEQLCEITLPSENTSNDQTTFLCPSSSSTPGQANVQWNGDQTSPSPLHAREMNINEFKGGVQSQVDEYPQRPGEPECQFFMKTGYCKFKSARRYLPKLKCRGPVEQLGGTLLPSENTSEEQEAVLGLSSSKVPDLFTPNQGLESNAQCNENQTVTSLLHAPDIKTIDQQQELVSKDAASEFSGGEPQQFDEYPQRPSEPECQYFMKTGYCKFKSACRYHHPKSNLSSLSLSLRPASNNSVPFRQDDPVEQLREITLPLENTSNDQTAFLCPSSSDVPSQVNVQWNVDQMATSPLNPPEIKMNLKVQELANKDTAHEFYGRVESQQIDEYPQRPGEPECQHFMKTGYCKFKSACRFHHPKSNICFLARPLKPDKPSCTHYSRGNCKFGSACRFNHHIEHG